MHKLIVYKKRWIIKKGGKSVLFGVGTPAQALAIAKAHGLILVKFTDLERAA